MTVTTDRVDVSYSGYRLVDDNIPTIPSPQQLRDCSGLVCPLDAGAAILTGTDTGFITVGVSLLDSEPEFALDGWEESVDVSIHAPQGSWPWMGSTTLRRCRNSVPPAPAGTGSAAWHLESTEEHLLLVSRRGCSGPSVCLPTAGTTKHP